MKYNKNDFAQNYLSDNPLHPIQWSMTSFYHCNSKNMIAWIHKWGLNRNRLCILLLTCHITRSLHSDWKDNESFSFPLKCSSTGNVASMEREVAQSSISIWLFSCSVHTSLTPKILQCLKYCTLFSKGCSKLRYINLDKRNSVFRSVFFFLLCSAQVFLSL